MSKELLNSVISKIPNTVKVKIYEFDEENSDCLGYFVENEIHININEGSGIGKYRREAITLIHEYGHYLSYSKKPYNMNFYSAYNKFDENKKLKLFEMKLVLTEEFLAWYFGFKYFWKQLGINIPMYMLAAISGLLTNFTGCVIQKRLWKLPKWLDI